MSPAIYVLNKNKKNITIFVSKKCHVTAFKIRSILHRRAIVMVWRRSRNGLDVFTNQHK